MKIHVTMILCFYIYFCYQIFFKSFKIKIESNIHLFVDNIYKKLVKGNNKIFNEGILILLE